MPKFQDLTGKRFGKLLVLGRSPHRKNNKIYWDCICDCGTNLITSGQPLKGGRSKSCGCIQKIHGEKRTRLYRQWQSMLNRCRNQNMECYPDYGERGITVCDEWRNSFIAFRDWAYANGYKEEPLPSGRNKWTLERKDNALGYSPDNCVWATAETQARNRRVQKRSTTGIPGVTQDSKTLIYRARITASGKKISLGYHGTSAEAKEARRLAEIKYWGHTNL